MGKTFSCFCGTSSVAIQSTSMSIRPKPAKILTETEIEVLQDRWLRKTSDSSDLVQGNGAV